MEIADYLGISESCLRRWMHTVEVDRRGGASTDEHAELVSSAAQPRAGDEESRS